MAITEIHEPPSAEYGDAVEFLITEARQRTRRRRLRVGAVAISVLVIGVAGLVESGRGTPIPRAGTGEKPISQISVASACVARHLRLIDVGTPGGMAGSWQELFVVKNSGDRACSMSGFAAITLVTAHGVFAHLQVDTFKNLSFYTGVGIANGASIPRVTLPANSGYASFWITGRDIQIRNDACRGATVVRATLARRAGTLSVAVNTNLSPLYWCGNSVGESPLVPGVSGSLPARSLKFFFGATRRIS